PGVHRWQPFLCQRRSRRRQHAAAQPEEHVRAVARYEHLHPGAAPPRWRQAVVAHEGGTTEGGVRVRGLPVRIGGRPPARAGTRGVEAALLAAGGGALVAALWLFWRHCWFWRNPSRVVPPGEHLVSPADGTVVYVKRAEPSEPVVVCKRGRAASINDIARAELRRPRIPG